MKKIQSKLFGLAALAGFLMIPSLASATCYVGAASALPYSVPAAGMTGAIAISAPAGCPWTFTARGSAWVRMLSATSGSGSATIYYQVLPNYTGRARSVGFGPEGVLSQTGGIGTRSGTVYVVSQGFTITMTQAAH